MQRSNVQGRQRYRFEAVLTTSRRDTVYARAHDLAVGQDVLVTRLPIQPAATAAERHTLLVRAGLMSAVTGALPAATTPGLEDAFIDGDGLFLVSAAAPDVSLRTAVESGLMDVPTAARLGADILAALDSAHEMRLIHGALDPDSVHLTRSGHATLRGFGVNGLRHDAALIAHPQTETGFGAPELDGDELPTEATDLFGLGAVLFYAIEGTGPQPSLLDAMDDAAWSAFSLGPLTDVVRRLLAWDPAGRPNVAEIGRTLSAVAGPHRELTPDVIARAQGDQTIEVLAALFGPPAPAEPAPTAPVSAEFAPTAPAFTTADDVRETSAGDVHGSPFEAVEELPTDPDELPAAPVSPWDAPPSSLLGLFDEPGQTAQFDVPLWQPSVRAPEPPAVPAPAWTPPVDETRWRSESSAGAAPESPWYEAPETRHRPTRPWLAETDVPPPVFEPTGEQTLVQPYVLAPPTQPAPARHSAAVDDTPRISRRTLLGIGGAVVIAGGAVFAGIELFGGGSSTKASGPKPGPTRSTGPTAPPPTPGTARWTVAGPANLYLRPFVSGDLLIASGDSVVAVHVADGSPAWTLPGARRHLTPSDGVIVGVDGPDGAHRLLTLNPKDGMTTGAVPLTTSVLGIAVANGVAYIIGGPHALDRSGTVLQAVDVATGSVRWSNTVDLYLSNSPILDDTNVYVAGPSGVIAYDLASGHQTWRNTTVGGTQRSVRSAADGMISTRGNDGIYTLDPSDGHVVWTLRQPDVPYLSSDNSLANGIAYASGIGTKSATGRIRAIDEQHGTVKWTFDPKDGRSHAVIVNGIVYSTGTTSLVALDSAQGTSLWTHTFDGSTIGAVEPVLAGGVAIVPTAGGHLNAVETGVTKD